MPFGEFYTNVCRHYTEDVCEPKTDNSGIVQGRLLKRHRAAGADGVPLTFRHFNVGSPVVIYGRSFNVIACDAFTRDFLAREGVHMAPDEQAPAGLTDEGNICALLAGPPPHSPPSTSHTTSKGYGPSLASVVLLHMHR